jgi:hypothetical protein
MRTAETLKAEIATELDRLPVTSLRTLAEFAAFLRSKIDPLRDGETAVDRYVAGYREFPETAEETDRAYSMSHEALAGEPWE